MRKNVFRKPRRLSSFILAAGLIASVCVMGCANPWKRTPLPSNGSAQWPNMIERGGLVYLADLADWIEAGNRLELGIESDLANDTHIPAALDWCNAAFCRDFPTAKGCPE